MNNRQLKKTPNYVASVQDRYLTQRTQTNNSAYGYYTVDNFQAADYPSDSQQTTQTTQQHQSYRPNYETVQIPFQPEYRLLAQLENVQNEEHLPQEIFSQLNGAGLAGFNRSDADSDYVTDIPIITDESLEAQLQIAASDAQMRVPVTTLPTVTTTAQTVVSNMNTQNNRPVQVPNRPAPTKGERCGGGKGSKKFRGNEREKANREQPSSDSSSDSAESDVGEEVIAQSPVSNYSAERRRKEEDRRKEERRSHSPVGSKRRKRSTSTGTEDGGDERRKSKHRKKSSDYRDNVSLYEVGKDVFSKKTESSPDVSMRPPPVPKKDSRMATTNDVYEQVMLEKQLSQRTPIEMDRLSNVTTSSIRSVRSVRKKLKNTPIRSKTSQNLNYDYWQHVEHGLHENRLAKVTVDLILNQPEQKKSQAMYAIEDITSVPPPLSNAQRSSIETYSFLFSKSTSRDFGITLDNLRGKKNAGNMQLSLMWALTLKYNKSERSLDRCFRDALRTLTQSYHSAREDVEDNSMTIENKKLISAPALELQLLKETHRLFLDRSKIDIFSVFRFQFINNQEVDKTLLKGVSEGYLKRLVIRYNLTADNFKRVEKEHVLPDPRRLRVWTDHIAQMKTSQDIMNILNNVYAETHLKGVELEGPGSLRKKFFETFQVKMKPILETYRGFIEEISVRSELLLFFCLGIARADELGTVALATAYYKLKTNRVGMDDHKIEWNLPLMNEFYASCNKDSDSLEETFTIEEYLNDLEEETPAVEKEN